LSTSFVCVTPTPRLTLFPYTTLFRSLRLDVVLQRPGTDGEEARGNDLLAPLLVRRSGQQVAGDLLDDEAVEGLCAVEGADDVIRSEEHTSELQSPCNLAWSPCNLVCRLLLEKKNDRHAGRGQRLGHEGPAQAPHPCDRARAARSEGARRTARLRGRLRDAGRARPG